MRFVEERFEAAAFVAARLEVHDPAIAGCVAEQTVDYVAANALSATQTQAVLAARLRMRTEQPASLLVFKGILPRVGNEGGYLFRAGADSATLELSREQRTQGPHAPRVPAAHGVVGNALQPVMNDRAYVARSFSSPRKFDLLLVAGLRRRGPAHRLRKRSDAPAAREALERGDGFRTLGFLRVSRGRFGGEVRLGNGPGPREKGVRGGAFELAVPVTAKARHEVQALLGARGCYI